MNAQQSQQETQVIKQYISISVSSLIPYARNNKNHGQNVERIAASIKRNEYVTPIIIDEDNVIIAGHGRRLAMIQLWIEQADVLQVTWLTEKQKADLRISDNRTAELSERDYETVYNEIMNFWLDDIKVDFPDIDFDQIDFDEETEDDVPDIEDAEEIIVQRGDVFQLWSHRLMCGDSMQDADVQLLLWDTAWRKVHCISDPPYGIEYTPEKHGMIENDDTILDYTHLAEKYSDGYFCMRTWYQVVDQWIPLIQDTFDRVTNMIIRHKWWGGMGDCLRNLAQDFEILLVSNRKNELQATHRWSVTRYRQQEEKAKYLKSATKDELKTLLEDITSGQTLRKVWKDSNISYMHPTQKPVAINTRVLDNFTAKGDIVLDLFLGSGSNLVACEKSWRLCRGMEIDPQYVQVIIKRYAQFTKGKRPITCLTRDIDLSSLTSG